MESTRCRTCFHSEGRVFYDDGFVRRYSCPFEPHQVRLGVRFPVLYVFAGDAIRLYKDAGIVFLKSFEELSLTRPGYQHGADIVALQGL